MAARSTRLAALAIAASIVIVSVACDDGGDETVLASLADPSSTATRAAGATDTAEILIVDGGFDRESVEVAAGATLRIINESGEARSVIVSGGNHSDEPVEIKPGEMLELADLGPGAYVITAADDPTVTAAVVVS